MLPPRMMWTRISTKEIIVVLRFHVPCQNSQTFFIHPFIPGDSVGSFPSRDPKNSTIRWFTVASPADGQSICSIGSANQMDGSVQKDNPPTRTGSRLDGTRLGFATEQDTSTTRISNFAADMMVLFCGSSVMGCSPFGWILTSHTIGMGSS